MYELLGAGIANIVQLKYLIPLTIGTLVGVIGGALPGVTITMTIIVALPFTFGLDPLQGLSAMVGIYVGGSAGGLITATLLGIPGTPSSLATMFDGFPMAKKGEPGARSGLASGRRSTVDCSRDLSDRGHRSARCVRSSSGRGSTSRCSCWHCRWWRAWSRHRF